MIICKDGSLAYVGATAQEAYRAYLDTDDDHNCLPPDELVWYSATEMRLSMTLAAKAKAAAKPAGKKP